MKAKKKYCFFSCPKTMLKSTSEKNCGCDFMFEFLPVKTYYYRPLFFALVTRVRKWHARKKSSGKIG